MNLRRPSVAVLALAALAVGCSSHAGGEDDSVQSAKARDTSPDVSASDAAALATGNTAFGLELGKGLLAGSDNVFYSPYSISTALAMTYAGAANDTKAQMAKALHFDLPDARLHAAFDALDLALEKTSNGRETFELVLADSLWGQKGVSFKGPFLDTLAVDYGSGVHVVDFAGATEDSRAQINHWVAEKTAEKIPDLLPAGSLEVATRFVLVNAIYFNAAWETPFDPSTDKAPFTTLTGREVKADVMGVVGKFGFAKGAGYQAVELPYAGRSASMVIVLPDAGKFDEVEAGLDGAFVEKVFASLRSRTLDVAMPKFSIDGKAISLKDELKNLGVVDAFEPGRADFSAMVSAKDALHIDNVYHQAFVKVAEAGTEAAAATGVVGAGGGSFQTDPPPLLDINRPFLFFIRDVPTDTVLFVGRLADPS